jgi:acyl-CoA thioesterase
LLDERHVLGFSSVGRARHRELLITPAERVESTRRQKREDLEWLRARSPVGERVTVARCAEELVAVSDYRGMDAVLRFDGITAGYSNIELVRLDHTE